MKSLLLDTAAGLIFLVVLLATRNLAAAVILGGLATAGVMGWLLVTGRAVAPIQGLSLVLVVGLGGLSLATRDPRFVMLKPSLVQVCVGCALLQPGWMRRYLSLQQLAAIPPRAVVVAGYGYVLLLFGLAVANLAVALIAGPVAWAAYSATAPLIAFGAMGAAVFITFRALARRQRLRHSRVWHLARAPPKSA